MSVKRCDNYDVCKKYGLYGKCEYDDNENPFSLNSFCNVYEKQTIRILASVDEKLEMLLHTKADT